MRSVDRSSRTPPWQQIAATLREEITEGRYGPDDRLPSVAEIAAAWSVNRKTANKALKALAAEGLIETEEGMGYYLRRA
jgi:GntR family phosphonate transport system transcriptional regulator